MPKQFSYQTTIPDHRYTIKMAVFGAIIFTAAILGAISGYQYSRDKKLRTVYGPVVADLVENNNLKNLQGEKRVVYIQQQIDAGHTPSNTDYIFLSSVLTGPPDPDAQADAIIALDIAVDNGLMSESQKRYVAFATVATLNSPDDRLRTKECSLLGKLDTKAILPKLIPLKDDQDPTVRYFAREALQRLGYVVQ